MQTELFAADSGTSIFIAPVFVCLFVCLWAQTYVFCMYFLCQMGSLVQLWVSSQQQSCSLRNGWGLLRLTAKPAENTTGGQSKG